MFQKYPYPETFFVTSVRTPPIGTCENHKCRVLYAVQCHFGGFAQENQGNIDHTDGWATNVGFPRGGKKNFGANGHREHGLYGPRSWGGEAHVLAHVNMCQ